MYKEAGDTWINDRIIEKLNSHYKTTLIPVLKPNGKVRLVGDYRPFNMYFKMQRHEVPTIDEIRTKFYKANIYSSLDFVNGFLHIPLDPASRDYTTFVDYMEHRLTDLQESRSAQRTPCPQFIAALNIVLQGMEPFTVTYVDDILLFLVQIKTNITNIFKWYSIEFDQRI